jgi:putative peptide zinc metalloprotease protein
MDGYWVASDLLGVFNLRKLSTELLKHYVARIFGAQRRSDFRRWRLSPLRTALLGAYSLLSIAFFVFLFDLIIRLLIFNFLPIYPTLWRNLYAMVTENPMQISHVLASLFTLLVRTLVLAGILRLLYGLVPPAWNLMRSALAFIIERYRAASLSRSEARSKA